MFSGPRYRQLLRRHQTQGPTTRPARNQAWIELAQDALSRVDPNSMPVNEIRSFERYLDELLEKVGAHLSAREHDARSMRRWGSEDEW